MGDSLSHLDDLLWFPNDRSDRKDCKIVDFANLSQRSLQSRSPPSKILGKG